MENICTAPQNKWQYNLFVNNQKTYCMEKYIANGRHFSTYEEAETYAGTLGLRITNTETIRKGVYLLTLSK